MQLKLRRAALGEHLREEHGSKEASTQTEPLPKEAQTPSPFRSQASAQTPRQRAESILLTQAEVGHFTCHICHTTAVPYFNTV